MAHYLRTFILQSLIDQGKLPAEWKDANVVPVYKMGSRVDVANYIPINIRYKILEHIIIPLHFHDSNKILCDHQYGF